MEITFAPDGWALAASICFIAFVGSIPVLGATAFRHGNSRLAVVAYWLVAFIGLYAFGVGSVAFSTLINEPTRTIATASGDLGLRFGPETGKKYPYDLQATPSGEPSAIHKTGPSDCQWEYHNFWILCFHRT